MYSPAVLKPEPQPISQNNLKDIVSEAFEHTQKVTVEVQGKSFLINEPTVIEPPKPRLPDLPIPKPSKPSELEPNLNAKIGQQYLSKIILEATDNDPLSALMLNYKTEDETEQETEPESVPVDVIVKAMQDAILFDGQVQEKPKKVDIHIPSLYDGIQDKIKNDDSKLAKPISDLGHSNIKKIFEEALSYDPVREDLMKKFVRQQLVMSHLMNAIDNPDLPSKQLKINKQMGFVGFGIAFHTEELTPFEPEHKLVFPLIEVEPDSPADACGLSNGQRVIAVNDLFINKDLKTLDEVLNVVDDSFYTREYTEVKIIESALWDQCMENPQLAEDLIPKR